MLSIVLFFWFYPCFWIGVLLVCGVWCLRWLRSLCSLSSPYSRVFFCCDCLSCTCSGGAGCLVTVFCTLFAAPVCWASLGSLLRHSVTLASCRTLSFCYFSPGFFPLAFIQAWVWGGAVLVMDPPFLFFGGGGGGSLSLVLVVLAWLLQLFHFVQVIWVSWTFCWGLFSLDFQCFAGSSVWVAIYVSVFSCLLFGCALFRTVFVSSFFWLRPSKLLGVVLR